MKNFSDDTLNTELRVFSFLTFGTHDPSDFKPGPTTPNFQTRLTPLHRGVATTSRNRWCSRMHGRHVRTYDHHFVCLGRVQMDVRSDRNGRGVAELIANRENNYHITRANKE